ncbi:MAG: hypothetical protein CVV29_06565 [Methanobacteriales archaeon HGW-Methanobacteriales-2]|nr:MAG: hypothetical protein CVV29_06565 [Methanobacteriales archaeon HGW-Methanobacteriales-2]
MKELKTKEDLNNVLKCYDEKECIRQEIAIVSLMSSSGLGIKDICDLNYFDFLFSVVDYIVETEICPLCFDEVYSYLRCRDDVIGRWELYNNKRNFPYTTFSTAESTHAILDWLYIKHDTHICGYEPLFTGPDGEKITKEYIGLIFSQMENKSGINISSHDLRRLFVETLRSNNVSEGHINHFLGHKANSFPDYKTQTYEDILKFYYSSAASELSLNPSMVSIPLEDYYCLLDNVKYADLLSDW